MFFNNELTVCLFICKKKVIYYVIKVGTVFSIRFISFSFLSAGKNSWLGEFKRLAYHTPLLETEVLKEHAHQVLHVSFSHNGKLFATCSKDGYIVVSRIFF